jgi:hypothetical protein
MAPLPDEMRFDGNTAWSRLKSARTMPKSPRAGNALIGGLAEGFWGGYLGPLEGCFSSRSAASDALMSSAV